MKAIGQLSEEEAWELLEDIRWGGKPVCPHCGNNEKSYFLTPQSGYRTTKTGKSTYRRVWKCAKCRKQYSVLVGTVFHGSHIPLSTWLMAIRMMCGGKNGVSAHELHRSLEITYKTAWFMCHRIREAMKLPPLVGKLSGVVEADETWIGGKPRAGQVKNRKEASAFRDKKAGVATLVQRDGEARSFYLGRITGSGLHSVLNDNVDKENTRLMTDGRHFYRTIGRQFPSHEFVDHSKGEYARGDVTSNTVEGFFGQLKSSLDGTYHHVSRQHLQRYLNEFDYRYSTRRITDAERTERTIRQSAGRRLQYRDPAKG
ncbi:MAG: IS1595 family transposase [Acidimicrobiia bacterium]